VGGFESVFFSFGSAKERCLIRLSTPTTDDGRIATPPKYFSPRESSVWIVDLRRIFTEYIPRELHISPAQSESPNMAGSK
jgi:hypothetical protein